MAQIDQIINNAKAKYPKQWKENPKTAWHLYLMVDATPAELKVVLKAKKSTVYPDLIVN